MIFFFFFFFIDAILLNGKTARLFDGLRQFLVHLLIGRVGRQV